MLPFPELVSVGNWAAAAGRPNVMVFGESDRSMAGTDRREAGWPARLLGSRNWSRIYSSFQVRVGPLRQTDSFLQLISTLLGIGLRIPDHTHRVEAL